LVIQNEIYTIIEKSAIYKNVEALVTITICGDCSVSTTIQPPYITTTSSSTETPSISITTIPSTELPPLSITTLE